MSAYSGPSHSDLAPNENEIWKFITFWFHHVMRGVVEIGWMDPAGKGLTHFRQFDIGDEELLKVAIAENSVPGQSMYFRASTVAARETGYTTDSDFVQAPGIWGDLDTPEQVEQARNVKTLIRPNAYCLTGRVPHTRVQSYVRLEEPLVNPDMVRSLNRRFHALYGGDSSVVNPSRLMRLPGTIAWPWKAGRNVELTQLVMPNDNRPSVYPVAMIAAQLPQETQPETPKPASQEGARATLNTVSETIRLIRAGHHWHDNMVRVVAHWAGRGWSNAEILAAAESFTLPGYTPRQTAAEVGKALEGARRKWGLQDEDRALGPDGPASPFEGGVYDPWDVLVPPAFPIEALPPILRDYAERRADITGADIAGVAWSAISACSAAIDGRTRLRMRRHDTWSVPPALWVALVGRSSAKKTPAIRAGWHALESRQAVILRAYADQLARWKALPKEDQKTASPPPPPLRFVTHDATIESIQEILGNQSRGLGVLRDEIAGFIGQMEKYTAGRGGAADRAFYLQAFDGGPYVSDRIGRGITPIDNLLVTICGGIQPDRLKQFRDLADDGMWQRFVPIVVKSSGLGIDEADGKEEAAYQAALGRMVDCQVMQCVFSDPAHAIRERLEREIWQFEQAEPLGPRFASFCGKLPGVFGRLALVLHMLQADGIAPHVVAENAAKQARTLILQCVVPHAARVYLEMESGAAGPDNLPQAAAGYVLSAHLDRLRASDLTRNVRSYRGMSLAEVQRAVSPLVAGGWLSPEKELPSSNCWLVNPLVHEKFADRTRTEQARRADVRRLILEDDGEAE